MKSYWTMTQEEKTAYNKKNIPIVIISVTALVVGFFWLLSGLMNESSSATTKSNYVSVVTTTTVSVEEMKSKAVKLVFRDAVFEKIDKGTVLKTTASVFWAHDTRMLINANNDVSQGVIVYYDKAPEVLPGDEIVVYGIYGGVEEMLGNKYVRLQYVDSVAANKK